ncbi:RluA family pseudouridine synthase [Candidatus Anaplasma sp. TIGMIC]|uniref:RluA family pseudouridine synthase n=1 Tax=Candidatus Anaplasma sp. TIGMIC TaxID=3020713 RepID=UPI00232F072C|nr:RluA family pseudouridine synthase [Candidatus Anaplasma sp. TIGMIC]MDB1135004.1 RluA family pseudouridine synthase [Candidatus Anaplasma sp. TIGMIC]
MESSRTISIDGSTENKRLDVVLATALETSRSKAQRMMMNGCVKIFDQLIYDNSHITKAGEQFTVAVPDEPEHSPLDPCYDIPLRIVYEDEHVIVIDKDHNIATHPGNGTQNMTVANALLAHCGSSLSSVGSSKRPGIVHRLDKDTSGLLVAAKNNDAYLKLTAALHEKKFKKEYLALIWGSPTPQHGFIQTYLDVRKSDRTMMEVTQHRGKLACTEYKVEESFGNVASMVRCTLHTGRTHQIRVHMSHIGHSVIGDQKYGKNNRKSYRCGILQVRAFKRQALHSCLLGFPHPHTQEYMIFHSEPEQDIRQLTDALRESTAPGNTASCDT